MFVPILRRRYIPKIMANLVEKRWFDSDGVYVSVFSHILASKGAEASREELRSEYDGAVDHPKEIGLKEFLTVGPHYLRKIERVRQTEDKEVRDHLKKTTLPVGTISATFKTRAKGPDLKDKLKHYNSLIVLDFDNLGDIECAKRILSNLPYVYYVGLSVSGRGLFAIVPIDTDDFNEHKLYFEALKREMAALGLTLDKSGSDVTRLRVISYDPEPFFHEGCEYYHLPEDFDPNEETRPKAKYENSQEYLDSQSVLEHVEAWEEKRLPLDDYDDWRTVGMALSSLGEAGRELFHRVSQFGKSYSPQGTDRKFDEFLQNTRHIGLGSFFYKCHEYGIYAKGRPHYESVPFPVEVLPKTVQGIVRDANSCLNFPVDYLAPSLLFVAAVACGNSMAVEIKKGWHEKAILYLAIVGGRGTNKTGSLVFALEPLQALDNREYEKYAKLKAAYDKELRKPLKDRSGEAIEPVYCQTILADFTAEALVHQHKANPRALAVFFDELYGFVMNFNKYRSGSDEQMWTQLFNGGGTIVNRVSSDPVKVDDTCISIFGGIQPGVLKDFSKGKIENGFIDRWLFAYPDKVPYPKLNENEIDPRTKESWAEIVNRIHDLPFDGASRVLRFSPEAKVAFTDWYNNLSNEKNSGGDAFAGLAAKMDKYCARFALILEVLKYGCRESDLNDVSLESTRGAIALCYYFLGCGIKARKKFSHSPLADLKDCQRRAYEELPFTFTTAEGLEIAEKQGIRERTFKDWLKTRYFKHISHGLYEKTYK